jgi:exopolysaccharide biosynthesis polyprenyl glycosylphosphotransferase
VLVGDDDEARALADLFTEHPEVGVEVCGYVGGRPESSPCRALRWLGPTSELLTAIDQTQATGIVLAATSHDAADLNRIVRAAHDHGIHVTVSSGLHGISHRRIHSAPMSYEPLHQVERAMPTRSVLMVKRAVDVVGSVVVLVLTLPVMAVVAVAIKFEGGGPVLFRQERVGRDGHPFVFYKLRTMVPGSDVRPDETAAHNERTGGPLYKDPTDPRRTRVGKVLEATSIDELPQLWNVLRGDMSLVGPRPAIGREVEQFDDALLARHRVRPGMTGLWQVECRDNPHFAAYRRLDLFYVENLSLWLDAAILSATVEIVAIRAVQKLAARRRNRAAAAVATVTDTSEPTMDLLAADPPAAVRVEAP